jgi:hypothetical protein
MPVNETNLAMSLLLWVARVWPIVPALAVWLVLRARIERPVTFVVLGALVCFGVQWLVSQVALVFTPVSAPDASVSEQLLKVMFAAVIQNILLSLVVSLPLLWWLQRALRRPPAVPEHKKPQPIRKKTGARGRRRQQAGTVALSKPPEPGI